MNTTNLRKRAFYCILTVFLFPAFAFAQVCTDTNSIKNVDALTNASNICCAKGTEKKQRSCLRKQISRIRKTRAALNTEFVGIAVSTLKNLRSASCEATQINIACTDAAEVTQTELLTRLDNRCCDKRLKSTRRDCLKSCLLYTSDAADE